MAKITKKVRVTKQEIKHDDIQDKIIESFSFFKTYAKQSVIAGIVIIVVAVMLNSYLTNKNKKEKSASIKLSYAINLIQSGNNQDALIAINDIQTQYWGTSPAKESFYYKALSEYNMHQYDKAEEDARRSLKNNKGNKFLYASSSHLLGAIYEQNRKYEEAIKYYLPVNYKSKFDKITIPYSMYDAARCYEKLQKIEDAISLFKTIEDDYSDCKIAIEANRKRMYLEALLSQI
jgi:TolA-binding protein